MYRRALLMLTAGIIAFSALFAMFIPTASAAGTVPTAYIANTVRDAATKSTERNSLGMCLGNSNSGTNAVARSNGFDGWTYDRTQDEIASLNWFSSEANITVRQWFDGNKQSDGTKCSDLNLSKALSDLRLGDGVNAACAVGFVRQNGSNCTTGNGDFKWPNTTSGLQNSVSLSKQDVLNNIDKKYQGVADLTKNYTREQYYVMALDVLQNSSKCNAQPLSIVADNNANDKAKANDRSVQIVDSTGKKTAVYYQINGDKGTEWAFRNGLNNDRSANYGGNCAMMINIVNDNANAYAAWVAKNPSGTTNNSGTCTDYAKQQSSKTSKQKSIEDACNAGLKNKDDANYCAKTYPIDFQTADGVTDEYNGCVYGRDRAIDPNANPDAGGEEQTSCNITGIGWFMCPAMNFMAAVTDGAYTFLANYFLSVDAETVDAARPAWEKFRDIANVAFVIAIIFIVYAQITSFGISNYGIKRMLPKLAIAAILVNASFIVCQIAVDLSNVIGYAIPQFLSTTIQLGAGESGTDGTVLGSIVGGLTWVGVIGGVLAATAALALAISAPVLLAALLAIAMIVFILIARQAIIILLIVIAPLAFVAYLLPNTEQWFKKWYKMFFTMLMLFPIIGIVFGASQLAANALYSTSGNGASDWVAQITALAVTAIPFFVVPGMLKGALNATGALGQKMQGFANKASGRVGGKVKTSSKLGAGLADMKSFREKQRAIKYAKNRGKGAMGVVGSVMGRKSASGESSYNQQALIRADQLENQEYEENVKAAMENQKSGASYEDKMGIATGAIAVKTEAERDAAVRFMLDNGNFSERRQVYNSLGSMSKKQKHNAIDKAFSKGDGSLFGSSTLGAIQDAKEGSLGTAADVERKLDEGFASKMNAKAIKGAQFHKDDYTASFIDEQLNGKFDKNGNMVKGPNTAITAENREAFAKSLNEFALTDQGMSYTENTDTGSRAAKIIAGHTDATKIAQTVVNPVGVPQGGQLPGGVQGGQQQAANAQPQGQATPTAQQQAPQHQAPTAQQQSPQNNSNQLNIPHGNNTTTTTTATNTSTSNTTTNNVTNNNVVNNQSNTTVPGTSNFVQAPGGLYVPPSALNSAAGGSASSKAQPITPATPTPTPPQPDPITPPDSTDK